MFFVKCHVLLVLFSTDSGSKSLFSKELDLSNDSKANSYNYWKIVEGQIEMPIA